LKTRVKTGLKILSLACALAATANAQAVEVGDASRRVSPRSAVTYLDLVRAVFPDVRSYRATMRQAGSEPWLEDRLEATGIAPVRRLFGGGEGERFEGRVQLDQVEALRVLTREGERLLLMMSVTPIHVLRTVDPDAPPEESAPTGGAAKETRAVGTFKILALLRLAPKPELLDAADPMRGSRMASDVYFSDLSPHLRVRARQDGFFIINLTRLPKPKSNLYAYTLLTAERDHLEVLSDFPLTLTESEECEVRTESSGSFAVGGAGAKGAYRPITVESIFEYEHFASDCRRRVGRSRMIARYDLRWDAGRRRYNFLNRTVRHFKIPPGKREER
jgi:hypothetical protein